MAKQVADTKEILLLDGETVVKLRPASITTLKKIMAVIERMSTIDDENSGETFMDVLTDASAVAVASQLPHETRYLGMDKDRVDYESVREEYTDLVDMETVNYINEVCGGISMDPKLLEAAGAGTN